MKNKQILLLHMRKDFSICVAEYKNFIDHLQIGDNQIKAINLYENPKVDADIISEYDGLLVGGLSDDPNDSIAINNEIFPFLDSLELILDKAIDHQIPSLLSCGGFMIASVLLGGTLTLDKEYSEMNIIEINLTQEAQDDILLSSLPEHFNIVSGHLKSTLSLPPTTELLAYSEKCPIHAFKVIDAPFYAFQGHPEITSDTIKERVRPYKDKYFENEEDYESLIQSTKKTKEANSILLNFRDLVLHS